MKKNDIVRIFLNLLGISSFIGFFILPIHSVLLNILIFVIPIIIVYGKVISKNRLQLLIDKYKVYATNAELIKSYRESNIFLELSPEEALFLKLQSDVMDFKKLLEDYEKSVWRSVSFTEEAQIVYDILSDRFENQRYKMEEEHERRVARAKGILETELFIRMIEKERLQKQEKAIHTFFKNNGLIVDDIRNICEDDMPNISSDKYLVYANLSIFKVELKKEKVIYLTKLKE